MGAILGVAIFLSKEKNVWYHPTKTNGFFPRKMVVWSLEHEFSEGFSQTVRGLGWQ